MINKLVADPICMIRLLAQLGASTAQMQHEIVQETGKVATLQLQTTVGSRWGSAMAAALANRIGTSCYDRRPKMLALCLVVQSVPGDDKQSWQVEAMLNCIIHRSEEENMQQNMWESALEAERVEQQLQDSRLNNAKRSMYSNFAQPPGAAGASRYVLRRNLIPEAVNTAGWSQQAGSQLRRYRLHTSLYQSSTWASPRPIWCARRIGGKRANEKQLMHKSWYLLTADVVALGHSCCWGYRPHLRLPCSTPSLRLRLTAC